jgi:hypothetical protein
MNQHWCIIINWSYNLLNCLSFYIMVVYAGISSMMSHCIPMSLNAPVCYDRFLYFVGHLSTGTFLVFCVCGRKTILITSRYIQSPWIITVDADFLTLLWYCLSGIPAANLLFFPLSYCICHRESLFTSHN